MEYKWNTESTKLDTKKRLHPFKSRAWEFALKVWTSSWQARVLAMHEGFHTAISCGSCDCDRQLSNAHSITFNNVPLAAETWRKPMEPSTRSWTQCWTHSAYWWASHKGCSQRVISRDSKHSKSWSQQSGCHHHDEHNFDMFCVRPPINTHNCRWWCAVLWINTVKRWAQFLHVLCTTVNKYSEP